VHWARKGSIPLSLFYSILYCMIIVGVVYDYGEGSGWVVNVTEGAWVSSGAEAIIKAGKSSVLWCWLGRCCVGGCLLWQVGE
jgi:hypothetical protein